MASKKKPPKPKEKYAVEEMVKALVASGGMVSIAARALGCSVSTINNYRDKHPEVAEVIQSEREAFVDEATTALRDQVKKGNIAAIIFVLKTLGKARGFIEKSQIEHSGEIGAGVLKVPEPASAESWGEAASIVSARQEEAAKGVS